MAFSKSFPKTAKGSNYPRWEEVSISEKEEREEEQRCRRDNIGLIKECIEDAKDIFRDNGFKRYQSDLINTAIALFNKRASYAVHYKEERTKKKFDRLFSNK